MKCNKANNAQFSSASAICPAAGYSLEYKGEYVKPIVNVLTTNDDSYRKSDIVAIVGDRAFDRIQSAINGLNPHGPIKKLIVFGTQPNGYLLEHSPLTVSFSFKDLHEYCAPTKVNYYEPEFIELEFSWLKDTLASLDDLLAKVDQLSDEVSKHIRNLARSILADINFNNDKLTQFKEYFKDFINEKIDEPEICQSIIDWSNDLSYVSSSNPKNDYAENARAKILRSDRSIRRQLCDLEGYGNCLVIDAPYHGHKYDVNPISTVMRYHLFPRLICLYYKEIETPCMEKSKAKLRKDPFFASQEDNTSNTESSNSENGENIRLEDYFDREIERYKCDFYEKTSAHKSVQFEDGTKESLYGGVLIKVDERLQRVSIADVSEKESITYYSQNNENQELFEGLVRAFYEFPEGKNVTYFVSLWQNAFRKLIDGYDEGSLKKFYEDYKISEAVCNNHINGTSKFMKGEKFDSILQLLVDNELLNSGDVKYIKAARDFMASKNITFGSNLKDALYRYRIDENDIDDFLKKIQRTSRCSLQDLMENFLHTKVVKKIEI